MMYCNYVFSSQTIPAGQQAAKLRRQAARLGGTESQALWSQASQLDQLAAQEVLDKCRVVAATCIGAGDRRLEGRKFHVCLLGEARGGVGWVTGGEWNGWVGVPFSHVKSEMSYSSACKASTLRTRHVIDSSQFEFCALTLYLA